MAPNLPNPPKQFFGGISWPLFRRGPYNRKDREFYMVRQRWPTVAAVIAAGRGKHMTEDIKKYRIPTAAYPPRVPLITLICGGVTLIVGGFGLRLKAESRYCGGQGQGCGNESRRIHNDPTNRNQ